MSLNLNLKELTRQEKLKIWMARKGITLCMLAERMGCSLSMVSYIINGKKAPKKRIDQLVALGVPKELLPGQ
ncbi:helix-turn-helix domain-containing protein [Desulfovulcanus sp.]